MTLMTTTKEVRHLAPGDIVRQFTSEPFRTVESVTLDGAGKGNLFYVVRFVGGGSVSASWVETFEVES